MSLYIIDNTTYFHTTDGQWLVCINDNLITPNVRTNMDLDAFKDYEALEKKWLTEATEIDNEVSRVETHENTNLIYITSSVGQEAVLEFDADTDQITGISVKGLDDGSEYAFSIQNSDWENQVIEETKDVEPHGPQYFYNNAINSFEAVGLNG